MEGTTIKKFLFVSVFNIFFIFCVANASENLDAIESNKENNAVKIYENLFENVKVKTLDNGLTVIMYKRGFAPVFSGIVAVRAGGSDEVLGKTGISHVLEHLAFKGTDKIGTKNYKKEKRLLAKLEALAKKTKNATKFSKSEKKEWDEINNELKKLWDDEAFSKEYEKNGAVDFNASTDKDITRYYVSLPKSKFDFWVQMESEKIKNPVMRQFYQERDVILQERKMRFDNAPVGKLYEKFLQVMFLEHPYRNPVIGYEDDIKNLVASDVYKYQKKYYVPSNMVVAIVGDIDYEKDFETIKKYFANIPTGKKVKRNILPEPKQEGERRVNLNLKSNPVILMAYHKPNFPSIVDLKLTLAFYILGGTKISPLYKKLVKETQCASSIGLQGGPGEAYPNFLGFFVTPSGKCSNASIIKDIKKIIKQHKEKGFTDEELEIAKRSILVSSMEGLNSNMYLAKFLSESKLLYGDFDIFTKRMKDLNDITSDDIIKTLKKYANSDNLTIGTIGK